MATSMANSVSVLSPLDIAEEAAQETNHSEDAVRLFNINNSSKKNGSLC